MDLELTTPTASSRLSDAARERILSVRGNPLFLCDWLRAVFIHYEVAPEVMQREVPFALDLHDGRAFLSLVAFTMRDMRPRWGGRLGAMLLKPIATHEFLNVRAYVKHQGETGIYFLAEWLPNQISLLLGPTIFGLPYRHGSLKYRHEHEQGVLRGKVTDENSLRLQYVAEMDPCTRFRPCEAGSREEFLMERYTAFTARGVRRQKFRIWHPPWPQTSIDLKIKDDGLLRHAWPWFRDARMIGANYSPGFQDVWMGRPQWMRCNWRSNRDLEGL
jgi:uncharacterized protein YqjF (DUF2071 family)